LKACAGFDIFMRRTASVFPWIFRCGFIVVGSDKMAYGGDSSYIGEAKTFKDWVLCPASRWI